ncbi:MAG: plasmid stabilization protein [Epsilonproteobacteria bacterium]|nr:plasmid stabilization protein [Campylobacterota bacterium]
MSVKFDIKYERSKKKIAKKIGLNKILETENLFQSNPSNPKLNIKNIVCKRDKYKQSIRVIGNDGYRILLTTKDSIVYFQDIMNHDKYDRLTKDC